MDSEPAAPSSAPPPTDAPPAAPEQRAASAPFVTTGIHRRRRPWGGFALLLLIAVLGGSAIAWRVLRDHPLPDPEWGSPLVSERFDGTAWQERWVPDGDTAWQVSDGHAVTAAEGRALLILRQRLTPPIAIEYTGQMLPGARTGDLSVWWSEREGVEADPAAFADGAQSWQIQSGAYENSYCAVFRLPGYQRIAYNALQLQPGRDYRFRVEIDGEGMRMAIDGAEVLRCRNRLPTTSGHIALYGYFAGKSFSDVRVWQKPRSGLVPAVATGDTLMSFGHYQDAATVYARLAEGDGPDAQLALFREGLAERRLDRRDLARDSWTRLKDPALVRVADALRLEDLADTGQYDLFISRFTDWWRDRPDVRDDLREQWQHAVTGLATAGNRDAVQLGRLLDLRNRLFPGDRTSGYETVQALLALGRFQEVLASFPDERRGCIRALKGLGRFDEVARSPYLVSEDRYDIAVSTGDYASVVMDPRIGGYFRAYALCKAGRAAEITDPAFRFHPAMLYLGKAEELLAHRPISGGIACEALVALGRLEEAAGPGVPGIDKSGDDPESLMVLGRTAEAEAAYGHPVAWAHAIAAAEAGDAAAAKTWRDQLQLPIDLLSDGDWFTGMVIGPVLDADGGSKDALREALRYATAHWENVFAKRPWLIARFALGECGEAEVMAMPTVPERAAWLRVAQGVKAELAGDRAAAAAAWHAFLALPMDQRLLQQNTISPAVECFVRWRLRRAGG